MPTLRIETCIHAPIERCFDLARDISLHCETAKHTRERAVAGVTSGLIGPGETVTFEGIHFGFKQRLTVQVTEFDRPHRFVDERIKGAFQSLKHIHEFTTNENGTVMKDTLIWTSPFGMLGCLCDKLWIERYLRTFLLRRNAALKAVAEAGCRTYPA
jgi:ligand-binding SRPBCC domain-containing protein